jgi:hypothetical protein
MSRVDLAFTAIWAIITQMPVLSASTTRPSAICKEMIALPTIETSPILTHEMAD